MESHIMKSCAIFRAVATLVKRDRQTQRQRDRQSCRGPSASQQQPYGGGVRAALGFSCRWSVRIILMKDRLFHLFQGFSPPPSTSVSNLKKDQIGERVKGAEPGSPITPGTPVT